MDALSLAGDLTIYGVRSDVKVIREENGVRTTASLDLTSQDIYDSPYFYLQQNDVIYVKPNKYRAQAGEISQHRRVRSDSDRHTHPLIFTTRHDT